MVVLALPELSLPTAEDTESLAEVGTSEGVVSVDKSVFASLKVRDYFLLWIGMVGSAFAMNMQLVAQGWLVYEMTVSAMNLAWVTLATTFPQIAFSLIGGVLADRFRKRSVIMYGQALNGVATLFMAFIILTGNVTLWDFIWVGFVNGTVLALSMPARSAFIPEIVGESLVFNAMAFNTTAWNLSRILGPALAGVMIAIFAGGDTSSFYGVGLVYVVLSALYIVSSATMFFVERPGEPAVSHNKSPFRDVKEGLDYAIGSPVIGGLIVLTIVPFLFGQTINTLIPAFNADVLHGGPDDLGILMAAMGIGSIAGALVLTKLGDLRNKGAWLFITLVLWGVFLSVFSISGTVMLAIITLGVVGFISAINLSMNRSILTLRVEPRMRGRIMSIDMMTHGVMPLGLLPISFVAEKASIEAGLALSGALLVITTIGMWFWLKQVRHIDKGF